MSKNTLMVLLLTSCLMLAFPPVSFAQDAGLQICKSLSKAARVTMESRQLGTPMAELIENVNGYEDAYAKECLLKIIVGAYKKPRFSTEEAKTEITEDFANDVYLECYTKTIEKRKE